LKSGKNESKTLFTAIKAAIFEAMRSYRCTFYLAEHTTSHHSGRSRRSCRARWRHRSIVVVSSGLPGFRPSRPIWPDAERSPRAGGCELWFGFEESATPRTELRFVPDHAHGDAVDVRNLGTAQAKRVAAARLLLVLGVSLARRGPHRHWEHCTQHQAEPDRSGTSMHCESPRQFAVTNCEWRPQDSQEADDVQPHDAVEIHRRARLCSV